MAWPFLESFDWYATADIASCGGWTVSEPFGGTTAAITAGVGRNGTQGIVITNGQLRAVQRSVTPTVTSEGVVAFGVNPDTLVDGTVLTIQNSSTEQLTFAMDSAGQLVLYRGSVLGTVLATVAGVFTANTYVHLQCGFTIHDSTGTVTIKKNGLTVYAGTSLDTNVSGGVWNVFKLGGIGGFPGGTMTFDDIYAGDDFPGNLRVVALPAEAGDGNSAQFTPSSGSDNGAMVDETLQDGDTTYNASTTVGHKDTYGVPALGLNGTIVAVQSNLVVRSAGAGGETFRPVLRIAGTDYPLTTVGLTTSYTANREAVEISPDSGVAFVVDEVEEHGIELVS